MSVLWVLDDDGRPVRAPSVYAWADWWMRAEQGSRRVARTEVGGLTVSTVFVGINHNWDEQGPPILYETMIFGATDQYCERYATREQAEDGHAEAVRLADLSLRAATLER